MEILEKIFGEGHPMIQKYYNYSAESFSYSNDHTSMLTMAKKNLEVVEHFNVPSDPK